MATSWWFVFFGGGHGVVVLLYADCLHCADWQNHGKRIGGDSTPTFLRGICAKAIRHCRVRSWFASNYYLLNTHGVQDTETQTVNT